MEPPPLRSGDLRPIPASQAFAFGAILALARRAAHLEAVRRSRPSRLGRSSRHQQSVRAATARKTAYAHGRSTSVWWREATPASPSLIRAYLAER